jgi:hypothetical protein
MMGIPIMDKICSRCGERYGVHNGTTCRDGEKGGFDDKDGKPVTEFEVGKWYKWVGPKVRGDGWNHAGEMDFVFDGVPHKCILGRGAGADFEDHRRGFEWGWGDLSSFREVPAPGKVDSGSLNCRCSTSPITIKFPNETLRMPEGFWVLKKVSSKAQRRREILARLKIE